MASQFEKRKAKEENDKMIVEIEEEAEQLAKLQKRAVYDKLAYDVFFDDAQHKFVRVTIEYDLNLKIGKVKEVKPIADSQPVAVMKMSELMNRKVFGLPPKEEK